MRIFLEIRLVRRCPTVRSSANQQPPRNFSGQDGPSLSSVCARRGVVRGNATSRGATQRRSPRRARATLHATSRGEPRSLPARGDHPRSRVVRERPRRLRITTSVVRAGGLRETMMARALDCRCAPRDRAARRPPRRLDPPRVHHRGPRASRARARPRRPRSPRVAMASPRLELEPRRVLRRASRRRPPRRLRPRALRDGRPRRRRRAFRAARQDPRLRPSRARPVLA